MTTTAKIFVLVGVVVSVLLVALVAGLVWGAVRQGASKSYEGYFAPVYSSDGQYVYFIERSTIATIVQTKSADLLFSPAHFDVDVAQDTFILKRLHVENGKIEELTRFPPSPIQGRNYEQSGNPFFHATTRLRFKEGGKLEYQVCLNVSGPFPKEYLSSGVWVDTSGAEITEAWKRAACMIQGYDEWPLFGDSELLTVRGSQYFPVAIVAYNHVKHDIRVMVKNKDYDRAYPNGVPLQQITENSRRREMERDQTVRRVYKELVDKYKAVGMMDMQAQLRAGKDMQRLGYYPKTTMIVARRLSPAEASQVAKDALFSIVKGEMQSGVFHDIEQAIASPGEEIDKDMGGYHIHRDYSNSARLNKFISAGNTRFYIEYLGVTYELTIKRPPPHVLN